MIVTLEGLWSALRVIGEQDPDNPDKINHVVKGEVAKALEAATALKGDIPHSERCSREMTRDVIFLFQTRNRRNPNAWTTLGVWLTREEGEEWGRRNEHRWGEGNWRVWGDVAEGTLAKILKGHMSNKAHGSPMPSSP